MLELNLKNTDCSKFEVIRVNCSNYKELITKYSVNIAKKYGNIVEATANIRSYYDKENGNPYSSSHLYLTFTNKVKLAILFTMEYNSVDNMKFYIEKIISLFINKKIYNSISYEIKKCNEASCRFFGNNIKLGKDITKRNEKLNNSYFVIEVSNQHTTITKFENLIPNLGKIFFNIKKNNKDMKNLNLDKFIQYYIDMLINTFYTQYKIEKEYCGMELTIVKAKL